MVGRGALRLRKERKLSLYEGTVLIAEMKDVEMLFSQLSVFTAHNLVSCDLSVFPPKVENSAETASDVPIYIYVLSEMDFKKSHQTVTIIAHHKNQNGNCLLKLCTTVQLN